MVSGKFSLRDHWIELGVDQLLILREDSDLI